MANKRLKKKISNNRATIRQNTNQRKENNAKTKENRTTIKANQETIKFSQKRAKEFRAAQKSQRNILALETGIQSNLGIPRSAAARQLEHLGKILDRAYDKTYMQSYNERIRALREENKLLREQNKVLREQNKLLNANSAALRDENRAISAMDKASRYDWSEDYTIDNAMQYAAIKKYHEWVSQGLIREASILDKYQYVDYIKELADNEMMAELVEEYQEKVETLEEKERKRKATLQKEIDNMDWSAWGF